MSNTPTHVLCIHTLRTAFAAAKDTLASVSLYLACSGGRDSLALAFACYQLYQSGDLPHLPILLHVHHGWQAANDDWADLVASWAVDFGFECRILRVDLLKNSETVARSARYQAMAAAMHDDGILMLAHHADDQAETVLMRLIDGAGVQGLSGMRAWQNQTITQNGQAKSITLWRPWLEVPRDAITEFAAAHRLPFVDDATNTDPAFVRGYLRQEILPRLRNINPKATLNIARSAKLLAQTARWQQASVDELMTNLANAQNQLPYQALLDLDAYARLPAISQEAFLHRWLQADESLPPSSSVVQSVQNLIERTDNDHASRMLWQGDRHRYVICCYDGCLYRYRSDVWQLLTAEHEPTIEYQSINIQNNNWQLIGDGRCQLMMGLAVDAINIQKVDKTTAITIGQHNYRAKKLAQKLRLPPWLRAHLWRIDTEDGAWLVAPMMAWRLPTGERVALDNFAHIGTMVYNG